MGTWQDKQTRIPIHSPRSHAAACSASTLLCRLVSGWGCTTVLHTRRLYSYCHIGDHSLPCSTSNPVSPRDLNRRLLSSNLDHSDIDRMRPLASSSGSARLLSATMPCHIPPIMRTDSVGAALITRSSAAETPRPSSLCRSVQVGGRSLVLSIAANQSE